jgi:glycogen debranching enzyme
VLDHNLVLKSDELYLVGNIETDGSRERATGLYARDTRHLNRFLIHINDVRPEVLTITSEGAARATVVGSNPLVQLANGQMLLPQKLLIERRVSLSDRFEVDITVKSFAETPTEFDLSIEFGADFRDLFDIRGFPRERRGEWGRPRVDERSVTLCYRGLDGAIAETQVTFDRKPRIELKKVDLDSAELVPRLPSMSALVFEPVLHDQPEAVATFPVALEPGESWSLHADVLPKPADGMPLKATHIVEDRAEDWIATDHPELNRVIRQALDDLDTLYTSFPHGSITAAGIPWFVAPFGRDSLIVGLQTFHVLPERAMETLRMLGALQGARIDPMKEEEPGKILHEMRYGEMARLGEVPHTPYYGTVDATPLFAWLFAETAIWTGDEAFYRELKPNVERAFAWIESYGDIDRDGFIEYRSDLQGNGRISNQVWKDSFDSLNHRDGSPMIGPIAAIEVQGYAYAAYARVAEVAQLFGDVEWAAQLKTAAERMRDRVESAFWLEAEGFYAQALDGGKRPSASVSSNPGHLLLAGLPTPERAARLVERLSQPDMESGWGIRTLSSNEPSYNPMSYHNGSIWPHDNSLIAAGAFANGDQRMGSRVFAELLSAALTNDGERLPELFCGFPRSDLAASKPVPYPVSCIPQAWAAGAIPLMIRAALGLRIDIETQELIVEPCLPDWLNEIVLKDVSICGQTGTLRVRREGGGYAVEADGLPLARS